jgi:hypothetical protein
VVYHLHLLTAVDRYSFLFFCNYFREIFHEKE